MIKLFDKGYVYFMWDDILNGKLCFVADSTDDLESLVDEKNDLCIVSKSLYPGFPFRANNKRYRLAYYDPQYEQKKAYNEGIPLQYKLIHSNEWIDCLPNIPPPFGIAEVRIKLNTYEKEFYKCSEHKKNSY
ncbi:MAG: hypothetical protein K5751_04910 [Treponemataceae bacterium]|nr:hypothetical protein [Treponemataceae bacterium]